MTTVLALDSAAASCSAAVTMDGSVRACASAPMAHGQAEALVPMLQAVMKDAGCAFTDIDVIAATVGPGSFTGIRVGLATARGLALAAGVPCLGVTTTEALAEGARVAGAAGRVLAVLDTRRADVYAQAFDGSDAMAPPGAVPYTALVDLAGDGPVSLVGDAADKARDLLGAQATVLAGVNQPDAEHVAALAARRFVLGVPADLPQPLYLKPPQATVPKDGGRLRP